MKKNSLRFIENIYWSEFFYQMGNITASVRFLFYKA